MIIKSYLVFPVEGQTTKLIETLNNHPACRVLPSTNRDLMIVVTESENELAEKALENQLKNIPFLQTLTLVSAHNESE